VVEKKRRGQAKGRRRGIGNEEQTYLHPNHEGDQSVQLANDAIVVSTITPKCQISTSTLKISNERNAMEEKDGVT